MGVTHGFLPLITGIHGPIIVPSSFASSITSLVSSLASSLASEIIVSFAHFDMQNSAWFWVVECSLHTVTFSCVTGLVSFDRLMPQSDRP